MKRVFSQTLLTAATLALVSCSSTVYGPVDENTPGATYEEGVPGATVVQTHKLSGVVTGIDPQARKVTFVAQDGKKTTVKCGPEVRNFDRIRVGDIIKATATDELTVAMAREGAVLPKSASELVLAAPKGAKPAALVAETQQYTATITAIDLKRRRATLRFPDGSTRTFIVRKDVDLTERKVGEEVVFRVATAMAVSIETP